MYLNHKKILELGLAPWQILLLDVARQNKKDNNLEDIIASYIVEDSMYEDMIESNLLKYIKGNKKDSDFSKLRIGKRGKEILEKIQEADVTDDIIKIRDWMVLEYQKRDKKAGNKKRLSEGLAQFSAETSITKNHLATLILEFLSDDDNMEYNNIAEKALFSSKNIYSRKFNINECRLFSFYEKRKEYFIKKFKTIKNG